MMLNLNFFRKVDFFGTPFTQQIEQNQSIYKSILGGIVTLTILSASLAYSVWVLFLWKTNQLSPKIQNSLYVSDFQLLSLDYEVIKLYFWKFEENMIDPFQEKVLLPMVMYTTNFSFTEPQMINLSKEIRDDGYIYYAPKMKLAFQNISGVLFTSSEMFIQIVKCEERFLQEGDKCASQELVDQFYAQSLNTIIVELHYKQLNSKDSQIQSSIQEFYIQIEPQNCYTLNTFLQSNIYQVDKSFLFGSPDYYEYINGALIQSQTNSIDYCSKGYSAEVVSLIYVIMKGNQIKSIFDYPKAGDLLANIGSIVSVLFMVKYVIIFLNEYFVNEKVIKDLINIYYPEFRYIRIKRNWRRKLVEVKVNEKTVEVNDYLKFYQQVRKELQTKLSYINLLYEVSRLYILIRAEKSREEIRKSHQVGVKLDFLCSDSALKSYSSPRSGKISVIFNDEDITLISLLEKFKLANSKYIPDELESIQNDFYNINKIL